MKKAQLRLQKLKKKSIYSINTNKIKSLFFCLLLLFSNVIFSLIPIFLDTIIEITQYRRDESLNIFWDLFAVSNDFLFVNISILSTMFIETLALDYEKTERKNLFFNVLNIISFIWGAILLALWACFVSNTAIKDYIFQIFGDFKYEFFANLFIATIIICTLNLICRNIFLEKKRKEVFK